MTIEDGFFSGLYGRMTEELENIRRNEADLLRMAAASMGAVKKSALTLREYVLDTGFDTEQEEMHFFRETKPRFYRHLIYFSKMTQVELGRPSGGMRPLRKFLYREQDRLAYFFKKYKDLYRYLRSGASYLDRKFFLRKENGAVPTPELEGIDKDPQFTTSHDFIVAKMSANELMEEYLSAEINRLETTKGPTVGTQVTGHTLSWTAPKSSLTELLYALHAAGVFNNGNTSIQQVASFLENTFSIRLGNYYRSFQELRIRKKNRAQFIDELKSKLIRKMDYDDEHPR